MTEHDANLDAPLKGGDWKMTVQTLQAGQRGNYADHVHTYRVFFHSLPYTSKQTKVWEPAKWADSQEMVLRYLKVIHGWVEKEDVRHPFETELDFAKQVGPGTWEFSVRQRYTG